MSVVIPLIKNAFIDDQSTRDSLADYIRATGRLSMGPMCREFEDEFSAFQGRKHSVLVNSGASANLALLQSLKNLGRLKTGDRVGFSALTWATNVMPIIQMGLVPVPVDIEPTLLNSLNAHCMDALTYQALFVTNAMGLAGDLGSIRKMCDKEGAILLEDNCESLGSITHEGRTGNFGLASTCSFYVAHQLSTIEGGMVCTDDDELADMLRMVRANGWDRNLTTTSQRVNRAAFNVSNWQAPYAFYDLAYNIRPTEITGFLGVQQLKKLPESIAIRESLFRRIQPRVCANPDIVRINTGNMATFSPFAFVLLCRTPELREKYANRLSVAGVEIRPVIAGNITDQPFYRKYGCCKRSLPGTEFVHDCGLYFGCHVDMTDSDIEAIQECLKP